MVMCRGKSSNLVVGVTSCLIPIHVFRFCFHECPKLDGECNRSQNVKLWFRVHLIFWINGFRSPLGSGRWSLICDTFAPRFYFSPFPKVWKRNKKNNEGCILHINNRVETTSIGILDFKDAAGVLVDIGITSPKRWDRHFIVFLRFRHVVPTS